MKTQSIKHVERRKVTMQDDGTSIQTQDQQGCSVETLTFEQLSPEIQQRLRSAARILATGAIRAAAKQAQSNNADGITGSI
jgi:hypothetical protein